MTGPGASTAYDRVAFPGRPYPQTHPDRLALVGRLFGLNTPPVDRCRVLEIGCGDGSNLIPMAVELPDSEFAGLDLAETAIERGRALASEAGVKNVSLRAMDFSGAAAELGKFDYVIAHGVYSWIPAEAPSDLLRACRECLRPEGVAMVSYVVYPGGHITRMLRESMLFHAAHFAAPADRIAQARAFLDDLAGSASVSNGLRALLSEERGVIARREDGWLYHDELADSYWPVYFFQFAQHAAAHGFQYVGDADVNTLLDADIDPQALERARAVAGNDRIAWEQYLDLLRMRRFRQSLLCPAAVKVAGAPNAGALRDCYLGAFARAVIPEPGAHPEGTEEYQSIATGARIATNNPLVKAALRRLSTGWPRFTSYRELLGGGDDLYFRETMLKLLVAGIVDVRTAVPAMDAEGGNRPRATALARSQASSGGAVTNLLHQSVVFENESMRAFLRLLDGKRTRLELIDELARRNAGLPREEVARHVEQQLEELRRHALLGS